MYTLQAIQTCESIDLPIVNPPARVKKHLVEFSGANIRYLTPSVLRQAIQGKRVMKKTAAEILHFIMSDNMYDEMHNLRLVRIKGIHTKRISAQCTVFLQVVKSLVYDTIANVRRSICGCEETKTLH